MSAFLFDLHDALRGLRRDRAYAAIVIVTLALAIGATTAVFSIVDGVLLKPLAYRESQRLVELRELWRQFPKSVLEVNEQHFEYWRAHTRTFESMAQFIALPATMTGVGDAAQVTIVRTSGSLFDVLKVQAAMGRTLTPDDERTDRPEAVAITDGMWRQRFASDPNVVGRSVGIDGKPRVIVGVLPPDLRIPSRGQLTAKIDGFVPIHMETERVGWVGDHNNDAIGRLKPGVTLTEAQAELDVLQGHVAARATQDAHEPVTLSSYVAPLTEAIVGKSRLGLLLLLGAIAAVLLIACSNLANLSLTRAIGRQRDVAIRMALGASPRRLIARTIGEQILLAAAGGTCAIGAAWAALRAFVRTAPLDLPRVNEVAIDGWVVAFAVAASIASALTVAIVPAWRGSRGTAQAALRVTGTGFTSDRGAMRTRASLVALQVALSVTLLVVTALLGLSLLRLSQVDRGFVADRVLAVPITLPISFFDQGAQAANRYGDPRAQVVAYDRLLAGIHTIPGVEGVTTTSIIPLAGQGQVNFVAVEGDTRPRSERPTANFRFIAPDFFKTLGVSILRGRTFADTERDPRRPAPALVTQRTAAQLWPGADPLGKLFSRGQTDEQGFEVVGIVADARTTSLETAPPLMVYVPYWWRARPLMTLLIKASGDPGALMTAIRRTVRDVDPEIAIGDARPLERIVDAAFATRRYQTRLFMAFGAVALLIAVIGIYATTAYSVWRRRREMNIRVALGAAASQVVSLIVRQTATPILAGVAIGAFGAVAIGGVAASLLFDVRPRDPVVIASVVALVGSVGVLTCFIAARRGLSVNPAAVLHED